MTVSIDGNVVEEFKVSSKDTKKSHHRGSSGRIVC